MFYLSKFAWAVLQPSNFIAILLVLGVVLLVLHRRAAALRLIVAATALYVVAAFSPLANRLLHPLEHTSKAGTERDVAGAAGIIVLGGGVSAAIPTEDGGIPMGASIERVTETARLALRHPDLPVIFSGGSGQILQFGDAPNEADAARRFFGGFGIVPPRLRLEDRSRNTLENAKLSAAMLQPKPDQRWILVTSAFHMRRAAALFEAHGFRVVPWPVGFMTSGAGDLRQPFGRGSEGLRRMDLATKEWLGLFVGWLRGDLERTEREKPGEASRVSGS
ncbi:YdcF family protein [Rhodomicrobium sp. Az07]|uniref:YdcF family protein n=1 Tax=Rhodomicrobium sp. Az07 TaxID=2839034 RepID=UPI001BE924E3|nr:YdcF family protein [Rhodomicrobium sp. Az07]MBT3070507.1 YdcF family protein [Rhodomicrobium sp. Az07]